MPLAPTRWSPAVAALHIGLQDRLSPFAERMGHPLRVTDWAQFGFASQWTDKASFAVPSDPTLSMTYFPYFTADSSFGRLSFDMQISFCGVNLVGLAVALGGLFRVSASERTEGHLPHVGGRGGGGGGG